mmetsp:Transcript_2729/g.3354  ORF Transcript_2729/g.3354 Transcript_2729/m.3354 type:complete len:256 (-) Transcript_2729:59-826(-)
MSWKRFVRTVTEIKKQELGEIQMRRDIQSMLGTVPFSREQLGLLKNQFKALANEEMVLDFDSFKNLLRKLPTLSGNEEMLDVFCTAFDSNGDGEIEFKEFTAGLSTIFQGSTDERLRLCFDCYDIDRSGFIERDELELMLSMIYKLFYKKVPKKLTKKVDNIMDNLDCNPRDNKLSFEEFRGVVVIEPMILRCFMPPAKLSKPKVVKKHSLDVIRIVSQNEGSPATARTSGKKETDKLLPRTEPTTRNECSCSLL